MVITRTPINESGQPIGPAQVVGSSIVTQPVGRGTFVEVNGVSVYKPPNSTVRFSPTSSSRSYTVKKTIALPEKEYIKYEGPEEESATITTKSIFGTTPKQRQQYVREVEDYNKQIRAEKQKIEDYNKQVRQWNEKDRFQTVSETRTSTSSGYNIDITKTEIKESQAKLKTSAPEIKQSNYFGSLNLNKAGLPVSSMYTTDWSKKEKPTLLKELKSQATERYLTIPKYIGTGFGIIGRSIKTGDWTEFKEARKQSSKDLRAGIKLVPPTLYGGAKAFTRTAIETQPFRKSYVSDLYKDTRAFRTELKTPRRQAELILTGGELLASYGVYKATTPKIIQKPTIKATTKIIETPAKLKPITSDEFISITKYRSTTPEIQSTWFGLKKTPVTYRGEILSYTPKVTKIQKSGNLFTGRSTPTPERISTSLKYLEAPIKSDFPMVIRRPPTTNILKDTTFKSSETISGLPKLKQDISPIFQVSKGKVSYTIGRKTVTEKIDDLGLLVTKQKSTLFDKDLPLGVERFQTADIFKGQKSDIIQIDPSLIKNKLIKTSDGFTFSKTKPPVNVEIGKFFLGKTDTANIYGVTYTPKDFILKGAKSTSKFTALPESKSILPTTSETFRLYPPALPSPVLKTTSTSPVFTLSGISKSDRILKYMASKDSLKPLTELKPETTTTYFTTLDSGLTLKQRMKFDRILSKKSESIGELKIETDNGMIQIMKTESVSKTTPKTKLEFEKKISTESRLSQQPRLQNLTLPKLKTKPFLITSTAGGFKQSQSSRLSQQPRLQPINITNNMSGSKNKIKNRLGIISLQRTSQSQATRSIQESIQSQDQLLRQEPKTSTPTIPNLGFRLSGKLMPLKLPGEIPIKKSDEKGEPAYDVLIKVGNKWVNKTNGKRNIYSAMHRGADIVDNTVAKSFKIKKGTGRANIFKYNVPYNINKFYTPSKTRSAKLTGAYIEKNKFAIDTPGERRGLSVAKYLRGVKLI